jgi:hypothetical protein
MNFQSSSNVCYRKIARLTFVAACLSYLAKVVYVLCFSTTDFLVSTIADDGFYYWLIAKNLWQLGISSADFGQTLTSGYHPLWSWLLMPLTSLGASKIQEMRIFILFSVLLSILALVLMFRVFPAIKLSKFFVFGIIISAFSFQMNSMAGLEWPLILLCNVIYFCCLINGGVRLVFFFSLGILASLSRTDFGAIPLIIFIVAITFYLINKDKKSSYLMKASLATLVGAAIGLIVAFGYFYVVTGQMSQGSALVKHMWAKEGFITPLSIAFQFARAVFFIPDLPHSVNIYVHEHAHQLLILLCTFASVVLIFFYKFRSSIKALHAHPFDTVLVVSSLLIVTFYLFFYGLNTVEVQPWYTAQVSVPLIFLLLQITTLVFSQNRLHFGFFQTFSGIGLIVTISLNLVTSYLNVEAFPDQIALKNLGQYLSTNQSDRLIGYSGNGTVSFFAGEKVINLDGLVNNEIYAYMPKKLPCYLLDKKIELFNGFGASERFFGLSIEPMKSTPLEGAPVPMYFVNEEKIRATYGCLPKLIEP